MHFILWAGLFHSPFKEVFNSGINSNIILHLRSLLLVEKNIGGKDFGKTRKINGSLEKIYRGHNSSRSFNSVFWRHNTRVSEIIWESCSLPCVQSVYKCNQSAVRLPARSTCSGLAINPAKGGNGMYSCVTLVQCPGAHTDEWHGFMLKDRKKPTLLAKPTSHIQKNKEYNAVNNRIIFHSLCSLWTLACLWYSLSLRTRVSKCQRCSNFKGCKAVSMVHTS